MTSAYNDLKKLKLIICEDTTNMCDWILSQFSDQIVFLRISAYCSITTKGNKNKQREAFTHKEPLKGSDGVR